MGWGDQSYWLKGGTISLIIHIFLGLIVALMWYGTDVGGFYFFLVGYLLFSAQAALLILGLFLQILGLLESSFLNNLSSWFVWGIVPLMQAFLIGAIFGWIYGKLKQNNP